MPDIHEYSETEPTEQELQLMRDRMLLYIFPNDPVTEEEQEAFAQAVTYQIEHERHRKALLNGIPDGTQSFKVGDFQMAFEDGVNDHRLTRKTICDAAYAKLLKAGLLYRGLEGRCC